MPAATTATSRKAAPSKKALEARRKLAAELLTLNRDCGPQFKRMAELEAELKTIATDSGDSFKEDFGALGYVSASGAVASEFKGEVPQIVTEAWLALKAAERKAHVKSGLVKLVKQYSKASNGRVTVKVL